MNRLTLPTLICLFGLLGASCSEDLAATSAAPQCGAAIECEGAMDCAYGYCIAPLVEQMPLHARVLTPPGSPYLQQQVPHFHLGDEPALTIQLVQTVEITGVVRNMGDAFVSNLPGEIEAKAPGEVPGLDYRFTARSSDGLDTSGIGYTLRLLPGRDYEVVFRPDDKGLPPHTFMLSAEEVISGTLDLLLPALDDYVKLAGWVQWQSGKPITGCRLTVLLPDGQALPTLDLDTMQAAFSLRLPPETESVRVRIEPGHDNDLFPTFVTEPLAPGDGLELAMPALPPEMAPFDAPLRVIRYDAKGTEVPVSGVNLVLAGDLEVGEFRASAMTDDLGEGLTHLLPGTYQVLAASSPGQEYGATLTTLTWEPSADPAAPAAPQTIVVPNRPFLEGFVIDSAGEVVTSGQVQARRRPDAAPGDKLSIAPPPFVTHIDELGSYAMHVDSGIYDLSVLPAETSGAPPMQVNGLEITENKTLDLELPTPGLAHMTATSPEGAPLPDVTVELYHADDDSEPPRVLVKGTTNVDGVVDLLVPHSP